MRYQTSTIDIIGSIVALLEFPVAITSIVYNGVGSYTLTVCDVYHAQAGFYVTIDGKSYLITDVNFDALTITVKGNYPITVYEFELYHPFYFYGTPIQQGTELNQELKSEAKTPMIYFALPFEDVFSPDPNDPINRLVTGELYFLTQGNSEQWFTDEAYTKAVLPMRRLQEMMLSKMLERYDIFDIVQKNQEFAVKDFPRFGVYINEKGIQQRKWNDDLSGCRMGLSSLGIYENQLCDTVCYSPPKTIQNQQFDSSFDNSFN